MSNKLKTLSIITSLLSIRSCRDLKCTSPKDMEEKFPNDEVINFLKEAFYQLSDLPENSKVFKEMTSVVDTKDINTFH